MAGARKTAVDVSGQGDHVADFAIEGIGDELDRISFSQLEGKFPDLAERVEGAINRGATPGQIRRFAIRRGMPPEWVGWLENAARAVALE